MLARFGNSMKVIDVAKRFYVESKELKRQQQPKGRVVWASTTTEPEENLKLTLLNLLLLRIERTQLRLRLRHSDSHQRFGFWTDL